MRRRRHLLVFLAGLATCAGLAVGSAPVAAQEASPGEPEAFRWSGTFKLLNITSRASDGDVGFRHEGDDTRETNLQSLRLMGEGRPTGRLDWQVHYLNVKLDSATRDSRPGSTGAELFRYKPWRRTLEEPERGPGGQPSTQTVTWYHEIDRASLRWEADTWRASLGRQPITWGVGRFWQPTDLFGAFGPTDLETEFKPGVDAMVLEAFPGPFSALTSAYVLSPEDEEGTADSVALRWREPFGEVSDYSLVLATVRERPVYGGTVETAWLDAGWRLEAIVSATRREAGDAEEQGFVFATAGVDHRFADGLLAVLELYHHSAGAAEKDEVAEVADSTLFRQGFQKHLSRDVLGLSLQWDLTGLTDLHYTLLGAALRNQPVSTLHQATLIYSLADEADAVFSLFTGTGRGLDAAGDPRSEFGHVPPSLYVRLRFYF